MSLLPIDPMNGCKRQSPGWRWRKFNMVGGIDRIISPIWQVRIGLTGEASQVKPTSSGIWTSYRLLGVPMSLLMNKANSDTDPTQGYRLQLDVTPYVDVGPNNDFFSMLRLTGRSYFDLGEPGRSVLAMRALVGVAQGAGEYSLPPDQRFYGGGSGTIRGYPYQQVGPQFTTNGIPNGNPKGGTAIAAASMEFRQRFGKTFGGAIFVDGGQVNDNLKPDGIDFFIGVGFGVRYYTPIGPIRLDVAFPTRSYSNDDVPFEIYIGLGQAF